MPFWKREKRGPVRTGLVSTDELVAADFAPGGRFSQQGIPDDAEMHRGTNGTPITCKYCKGKYRTVSANSKLVTYAHNPAYSSLQTTCPNCGKITALFNPLYLDHALANDLRIEVITKRVDAGAIIKYNEAPDRPKSPAEHSDLYVRILEKGQAQTASDEPPPDARQT